MYDRQQQWEKGSSAIVAIIEKGVRSYFESIEAERAFHLDDLVLRCMDGRTPGGVHLAGSGVLLGLEGARSFAKEVERYGRLEAITYHKDCGAAIAVAKEKGGDPFELAKTFSTELAKSLGIEAVYEVENDGWEGFHHERVIYYDGTGRFDWKRVRGLPIGFVISRAYLGFDIEYAKKELEIAAGIALTPHNEGGHGFGELFNEKLPLLVIALSQERSELGRLEQEAREVIASLGKDSSRVRVMGYHKTKA
ncbi:MAG: hypothetical protein BWY43_00750 [candidate division WS2 bacterium ADurb.Bin280]|uniref:Uncharacterized protein n=1 Tax=candidate division WS2 bacterium ADurb.Bin280 TaxID=1852829 RepID=A0A1V5SBS3_9BACT|nr:MAG: hypothetical protein BWY43_00750 [candidate division WS2 bacterium ADurb.Bin280]